MASDNAQSLSTESARLGYEPPRVNFKGLAIFVVLFVLGVGAIQAAVWFQFRHLVSRPRDADAEKSAVPLLDRFPEPDVQPSPENNQLPQEDLATMRREDERTFQSLGWRTNERTGSPVIPQPIVDELSRRYATAATRPGNTAWPTPASPRTSVPTDLLGAPSLQGVPAAHRSAIQPAPPEGGNRQ